MEDTDILKEILKWQKLQGLSILKSILPQLLDTKEKKLVYELSDGSATVKEISARVKVATGTISTWWNKWLAEGIVIKDGLKYSKLISLNEISLKGEK